MIASDVPLPDPLPLPEPDVPDPTIASAVGAGVVLETTLLEVVLLVVAAAVLLVVDVSAGTVVLVVPAVPGQGMPSASLQRMGNVPMFGGAPVPPSHVVAAASKIAPTKCSGAQSACLAQDRKARIA